MESLTLYHFTCEHHAAAIIADGKVKPASHLTWRTLPPWGRLAWFTDLGRPPSAHLGLTRVTLDCDRMAYRFRVLDPDDCLRWVDWVRAHPESQAWRLRLEATTDTRPMHWYVSTLPVAVVPDGQD